MGYGKNRWRSSTNCEHFKIQIIVSVLSYQICSAKKFLTRIIYRLLSIEALIQRYITKVSVPIPVIAVTMMLKFKQSSFQDSPYLCVFASFKECYCEIMCWLPSDFFNLSMFPAFLPILYLIWIITAAQWCKVIYFTNGWMCLLRLCFNIYITPR